MNQIQALLKKHREIVAYLIVGGLTTLVNIAVFFPLVFLTPLSDDTANIIAVIAAVIFAYITNKIFVFRSQTATKAAFIKEMLSFLVSRLFTMFIEVAGYALCKLLIVSTMSGLPLIFNNVEVICKFAIMFFVIILNYVLSKIFVFRKTVEG